MPKLLVIEPDLVEIKKIQKIIIEGGEYKLCFAADMCSGSDMIENIGAGKTHVIIEMNLPTLVHQANLEMSPPQGLSLIVKCVKLQIPVIVVAKNYGDNLKWLQETLNFIASHQDCQQKEVKLFSKQTSWEDILKTAYHLKLKD